MDGQLPATDTSGKLPQDQTEQEILASLIEQATKGYRPLLPIDTMFGTDGFPMLYWQRDIEYMLRHPVVRRALSYFRGGIAGAEFWGGPNADAPDGSPEAEKGLPICPQDDKVGRFVKEQCERFWDRGVPQVQKADEYGWSGSEQMYDEEGGVLKWDGLASFAPSDTFLLTQDFNPVGIRIKNVRQSTAPVDLWMAGDEVPAKGLWYAHQPRYNNFYGTSQLVGAWRPWRRLAWKDGAETVLDGAMYRFGYQGPLMRYPNETLVGVTGTPSTVLNSQGQTIRDSRDVARMLGEQYKAGGVLGLPSTRDKDGNYKWDATFPTSMLTGLSQFIEACDYLGDQITEGIGVPPELLEASESGSGYSGRRIPLEAFLANQQQIADALLRLFVDQVLRPLVRWNFGWEVRFNVQVKSLIKTRTKQSQAANPQSSAGGQGPQPGQPNQPPKAQEQTPQPAQQNPSQAMFSHHPLVTDAIREKARRIVRAA